MRHVFNFMMGIFMGALVGATVALLLAPEPGDAVRADLRTRGEALLDDVRHAAESRRIELTDRLQTLRETRSTEAPGI